MHFGVYKKNKNLSTAVGIILIGLGTMFLSYFFLYSLNNKLFLFLISSFFILNGVALIIWSVIIKNYLTKQFGFIKSESVNRKLAKTISTLALFLGVPVTAIGMVNIGKIGVWLPLLGAGIIMCSLIALFMLQKRKTG